MKMIASSKPRLSKIFFKYSFLFLFLTLLTLPMNGQNPLKRDIYKHGLLVDLSHSENLTLWTIKYSYIFLSYDNISMAAHAGIMFGEDHSDSFRSKEGGLPIGAFWLWGNPHKGHFLEWGGELNIPTGDFYTLMNLHIGYRHRAKNAGLTFGLYYKYYYRVIWQENTVNISVGLAF